MRPGQLSYWQNYGKFHVSLMKAWFGAAATKETTGPSTTCPKLDKTYDVLQVFDMMHQGKMTGYFAQGFNVRSLLPQQGQGGRGAVCSSSSSSWTRWPPKPPSSGRTTASSTTWTGQDPDHGVPPAHHLLRRGRRRHRQLRPLAAVALEGAPNPRARPRPTRIMAGLFHCACGNVQEGRRRLPDPILNLTWAYKIPDEPSPEELAKEYNGKALADQFDARTRPSSSRRPASCSAASPSCDDGSTACGCWIFSGAWTGGQHDGPPRHRRPLAQRQTLNWAFASAGQPAHPLQPRRRRPRRQALGPKRKRGLVGRRPEQVGGLRRARLQRRTPPRTAWAPSS